MVVDVRIKCVTLCVSHRVGILCILALIIHGSC